MGQWEEEMSLCLVRPELGAWFPISPPQSAQWLWDLELVT